MVYRYTGRADVPRSLDYRQVGYALVGRRLRVEVSDDGGPARLRRRIHAVRPIRGRGLELVCALASRWGVRESSAGRTIWFEVDISGG